MTVSSQKPFSLSAFVSRLSGKLALTKPNHYKSKPNHIKYVSAIGKNADFCKTIYVSRTRELNETNVKKKKFKNFPPGFSPARPLDPLGWGGEPSELLHLERSRCWFSSCISTVPSQKPFLLSAFVSQPPGKHALTKPNHYKSKPTTSNKSSPLTRFLFFVFSQDNLHVKYA